MTYQADIFDRPHRRVVHGTPITPNRLLDTLAGESFCVSFAAPQQLDRCIDLVGPEEILILDNGAFSHWRAGKGAIDREAFWTWANEAMDRCPQAVAVIPDIIEGSEADNLKEIALAIRGGLAKYPERCMGIWHLNESQDFLSLQLKLLNFVGLGSCAEFDVQRQRARYLERLDHVRKTRAIIKAATGRAPWIHLMRGLGVFHEAAWAESADSTNVARNHCRHRDQGDQRARNMADRIAGRIQGAALVIPASLPESSNFHR